jgi:hypothetical protein
VYLLGVNTGATTGFFLLKFEKWDNIKNAKFKDQKSKWQVKM